MPKNISKNLEILAENEAKLERGEITVDELHQGMRPIIKSDTRADYDVHAKIDVSKAVIGLDAESVELAAAKGIEVPAPEPVEHGQEDTIEDTVAEPVEVTDSTGPVEDMANEPVAESTVSEPTEEPVAESTDESISEPVVSEPTTEDVPEASESVAETAQPSEQPKPAESEYDVPHTKPVGFAFDKVVEKTPEKTPETAKESVSKRNPLPDVSGILENGGNDGHGSLGE